MIRNDTERGVTCYFRFENVKIIALEPNIFYPGQALPGMTQQEAGRRYYTTTAGLKIARICASEVGKGNVVEYTETTQPNGETLASGLVRNPMGF